MRNSVKLAVGLLSVSLLFSACSEKPAETEKQSVEMEQEKEETMYQEMKGERLDEIQEDKAEKEEYLVIDVRKSGEYEEGHVKFAVNIPLAELEGRLSEIEDWKERPVVTVCNKGKSSAAAAKLLLKNGFRNVYSAEGVKDYAYRTMTKIKNVRGAEMQKFADEETHVIIDAREPEDYEKGHLKGAINVTMSTLDSKLSEIPTDKPLAIHCYSGNRSMALSEALFEKGFTDITNALDGAKEYEYRFEE